jgi:hypothetical protein
MAQKKTPKTPKTPKTATANKTAKRVKDIDPARAVTLLNEDIWERIITLLNLHRICAPDEIFLSELHLIEDAVTKRAPYRKKVDAETDKEIAKLLNEAIGK